VDASRPPEALNGALWVVTSFTPSLERQTGPGVQQKRVAPFARRDYSACGVAGRCCGLPRVNDLNFGESWRVEGPPFYLRAGTVPHRVWGSARLRIWYPSAREPLAMLRGNT
jgi:hypothetical protein